MKYAIVLAVAAIANLLGSAASGATLEYMTVKGFVQCGVSQGLPGFSASDGQGNWSGIDVDICRAVAAAMFGEPDRVRYTSLSAKDRFPALRRGEIDMLSRNTTWTLGRDAVGLEFAVVTYFDGQAFMVRRDFGVESVSELDGAAICVTEGTTTEVNLADYFGANDMTYTAVKYRPYEKVLAAYVAGECDVLTADQSALHAHRTTLEDASSHIILPTVISREPLGPVVCQSDCEDVSDDQWIEVIRWTFYAMLEAEARGVSSVNVDELRANSKDPSIRRLLGVDGDMGALLGLPNDWAYKVIKRVGNYAEVFDRNLGPNTPLGLSRGTNALWKDGGLHYPLPFL
jgi:general L-amino acid transport system substrate-binding protein